MSAPWTYGWNSLTLAAVGGWRVWAGFRSVWPGIVAAGGAWLRRFWQASDRGEHRGA